MKKSEFLLLVLAAGFLCIFGSGAVCFEMLPPPEYADFSPYVLTCPLQPPVETGRLTSPFGWRMHPIHGKDDFHCGADIACPTGTPVYAALAGKVIRAGSHESYGNYLLIDHYHGFCTLYAHCSRLLQKEGDFVKTGARIALSGETGEATGPHLHFEVRLNGTYLDPGELAFFEQYRTSGEEPA